MIYLKKSHLHGATKILMLFVFTKVWLHFLLCHCLL